MSTFFASLFAGGSKRSTAHSHSASDDPTQSHSFTNGHDSDPITPNPAETYLLPASFSTDSIGALTYNDSVQSSRATTPPPSSVALTGDSTLDGYRNAVDVLTSEVNHFRSVVRHFCHGIVRLGQDATIMSETSYDLCEKAKFWPPGIKTLMKAHRGWTEESSQLFAEQLESELLHPLAVWEEESDQFIRELIRTNAVRITMEESKARVDCLFLIKCDKPKEWDDEQEFTLKMAKQDFEVAARHLDGRVQTLSSHWESLTFARMNALDLVCTRMMTQQWFLFQPALNAFKHSGLARLYDEPVSPSTPDSADGLNTAPLTPSQRSRNGKPVRLGFGERRAQILERQQTRLRAKFSAPPIGQDRKDSDRASPNGQNGDDRMDDNENPHSNAVFATIQLMKAEMAEKELLKSQLESLRKEAEQARRVAVTRSTEADGNLTNQILQLQQQLQEKEREIEKNKEKLKQENENIHNHRHQHRYHHHHHHHQELQQQSQETEADSDSASGAVEVGSDASPLPPMGDAIVSADAPPPPPLVDEVAPLAPPLIVDNSPPAPPIDSGIPNAPPPPDGTLPPPPPPPGPPSAPGAPSFTATVKKLSVRDKEKLESRRYHLPLLPEPAMMTDGELSVKRFHWHTVAASELPGTVWEAIINSSIPTDTPALTDRKPIAPLVVTDTDIGDSEPTSEWQWPLDIEFARLFAQKSSKSIAAKQSQTKFKLRPTSAATTTESSDVSDDDDDDEQSAMRAEAIARLKLKVESKIELIDAKRSYNVSIALSHLKLDYVLIRNAVMTMDDTVLSLETLEVLNDILPTSEEVSVVTSYNGDVDRLGDVEKFMLCMSVPSLSSRLRCFMLMKTFSSTTSQLQDSLDLLSKCNRRVRQSTAFQSLLGLVLRFGNFLNSANHVQQHYGFALSTLLKVRGIKTMDNKSTLLHYLCQYIEQHCSDVRLFVSDLSLCKAAQRIEAAFLQAEVKALRQHTQLVKALIADDEDRRAKTGLTTPAHSASVSESSPSGLFSPLSAAPLRPSWPLHIDSDNDADNGAVLSASILATPASMNRTSLSNSSTSIAYALSIPPLPDKVRSFYSFAAQRVVELEQSLSSLTADTESLQRFYVAGDLTPEIFYQSLTDFVDEFKQCETEIHLARENEERKRKQLLASEAMRARAKQKASHSNVDITTSEDIAGAFTVSDAQ